MGRLQEKGFEEGESRATKDDIDGGAFLTEFERESGVMVKEQTPGNIDRNS